jgi:hypothetical protein
MLADDSNHSGWFTAAVIPEDKREWTTCVLMEPAVLLGVSLVQTPEPNFYYQSAAFALALSGLLFFVRRKRLSL